MSEIPWKKVELITKADKTLKTQASENGKPGYRVRSVLPASWFETKEPGNTKKEPR
jgi:hypothetical protein